MPIFEYCNYQLESSTSNLISESLGAVILEPVTLVKLKGKEQFFVRKESGLFLSKVKKWDKLDQAKPFFSKKEAEEIALNNGYFIDIKN